LETCGKIVGWAEFIRVYFGTHKKHPVIWALLAVFLVSKCGRGAGNRAKLPRRKNKLNALI